MSEMELKASLVHKIMGEDGVRSFNHWMLHKEVVDRVWKEAYNQGQEDSAKVCEDLVDGYEKGITYFRTAQDCAQAIRDKKKG